MDLGRFDRIMHTIRNKLLRIIAVFVALAVISITLILYPNLMPDFMLPSMYPLAFRLALVSIAIILLLFVSYIFMSFIEHNVSNNNMIVLYALKYKILTSLFFIAGIVVVIYVDGYILPYSNYERLRKGQKPIFMFTSSLLRHKDGGSQPYYGLTYKIFYYHREASDGTRTGPRLTFNFTVPFRDQEVKEEVVLRKWGSPLLEIEKKPN